MKRQLKTIVAFAAAAAMTMAVVVTASAADWRQDAKGWRVENEDGSYLTNQWYQSPASGLWYYMGADGYMLTNTTTPDGYVVNADGVWEQNAAASQQSVSTLAASDFIISGDSDMSWYNNSFLEYCEVEATGSWAIVPYSKDWPITTSRGISFQNSRTDVINAYGNPSQIFSKVTAENDGMYRYYTQVIAVTDPQYDDGERYMASLLEPLSCIHYAMNEYSIRFYFDQNDQVACIGYAKNIENINYSY
ncbi:hypothetical protein [Otoolea muris]|uniref:hypothetical protein n=1 Tax=Otoolea muris TaxID=2941515 RepID=UPI0023B9A299|nr:hypothetical protein [Otoolea muris]